MQPSVNNWVKVLVFVAVIVVIYSFVFPAFNVENLIFKILLIFPAIIIVLLNDKFKKK